MSRANKEKNRAGSALVTEEGVSGNPDLRVMKKALSDGYKANRSTTSRYTTVREYQTAMIENTKPIFALSTQKIKDANGEIVDHQILKLLFGAGWYLSIEEEFVRDTILADPKLLAMNEEIWASMEQSGQKVDKAPAVAQSVRVVS